MRAFRNLALASMALMMATAAKADLVTLWDFEVTSEFDTGSTVFIGSGPTINTDTLLAWGLPCCGNPTGEQSSLVIEGDQPETGTVATVQGALDPSEVGPTQIFVHNNNIIDVTDLANSSILDSVDVETTLLLTPNTPPGGGPFPFGPITFNVNFQETPNAGPCAPGTGVPLCADIFVLTGNLDAVSFDFEGYTYTVTIIPNPFFVGGTPLVPLSPQACAAAGAPAGCIGFLTNENTSNQVQFGFFITAVPITVPEPGSLALMALGLLGLGVTMRKRRMTRG